MTIRTSSDVIPGLCCTAERFQIAQQKALLRLITRIRESLELEKIFSTTALEVRQLLTVDRVGVFQFDPDSGWNEGAFVAEAVAPGYSSALATKVHDHCFGEQYAVHYQAGKVQAVADIYAAGLKECHAQILGQFQVRANLVVPVLQGKHLWGLLCLHQCSDAREWQADEIEFAQQVAEHLAIAVQQASLYEQSQIRAQDLTAALRELQHTQAHLVQHEKMSSLGQLVAGIAHEINNPVNFIHGNVAHINSYTQGLLELIELYQQEYPNPGSAITEKIEDIDLEFLSSDLPKLLASLKLGTDRIREIVRSLRIFSRLDEAEVKAVDIHEGIDSTLMILQNRLKARSDRAEIVVIKNYGALPLVECFAGQLNQVFMNIISNAIDALEERDRERDFASGQDTPSAITITTALDGEQFACIRIADNGPGISEPIRQRLFDPFFTTKPVGQGTGMGLSISYQIIREKHHGSLDCRSTLGQGAEFMIRLPLRSPNLNR